MSEDHRALALETIASLERIIKFLEKYPDALPPASIDKYRVAAQELRDFVEREEKLPKRNSLEGLEDEI